MPHRCVVLEPYGGCRLDEGHEGMHDDQAGLSNALCVMAFFLGMEHERHFDTHVAGWSVLAEATRKEAEELRLRDRPRWDAWP